MYIFVWMRYYVRGRPAYITSILPRCLPEKQTMMMAHACTMTMVSICCDIAQKGGAPRMVAPAIDSTAASASCCKSQHSATRALYWLLVVDSQLPCYIALFNTAKGSGCLQVLPAYGFQPAPRHGSAPNVSGDNMLLQVWNEFRLGRIDDPQDTD